MTKNTGWIAADDVNRLVREIDVALNGVGAAPQASLCDIAAQVGKAAREFGPILGAIGAPPKPAGAHSDDWAIAAAFREVNGPNGGLIKNDEVVDFISTRAREMIANARPAGAVSPLDRDAGGRIVREAWVRWALTQPDAKPSWLVPYDDLSEADKEADRQIFEACATASPTLRTLPEGWQITRNDVGGVRVDAPNGSWLSMGSNTGKLPEAPLEMRLLYGLAEALLSQPQLAHVEKSNSANADELLAGIGYPAVADALGFSENFAEANPHLTQTAKDHILALCKIIRTIAPAAAQPAAPAEAIPRRPHAVRHGMDLKPCYCDAGKDHVSGAEVYSGQDQPTTESDEHASRRLCQLIGKASFAHAADKQSAMELVTRLVAQPAVAVAQDGILIWIETLAREGLAAGSEGGRVQALKKIVLVAKESAAGNNAVNIPDATSEGTDNQTVSGTTAALIDMLRQRDATGLIKYGKTLDRTDLSQAEWLQHLAEEMLDGAGYALAAIRTLKAGLALAPEIIVRARFESCARGFHSKDYADGYIEALEHVANERQTSPTTQSGES